MKSILMLPLFLVACSAPPGTSEDVASESQAVIDPTQAPKMVPIGQFSVIPKLPAVSVPPLPHAVINIAPLERLPGIIWGLATKPANAAPVYKQCNPSFQIYEDACYSSYQLTVNECDVNENNQAQGCATALHECQDLNCMNQLGICLDEAAADCALNTYCLASEEEKCDEEASACTGYVQSNGVCGTDFTICLQSVQTADGECRNTASANYMVCSSNVGTCI